MRIFKITLKNIAKKQEEEYLAKEKQITTFLECKKSFFGKFKYYFKYGKKKNKEDIVCKTRQKTPCFFNPQRRDGVFR